MLRGRFGVMGMLVSFLSGGLLVGGWFLLREPSLAPAAHAENVQPATPPPPWLKGTTDEKFAQLEKHLRGLDVPMAEIGYRYGELRFAVKARNWEAAKYQAEKIDFSLRLAIERRPNRAKSAQPFLTKAIPELLEAIESKSGKNLDQATEKLHLACVQCHTEEKVLYFKDAVDRIKEQSK